MNGPHKCGTEFGSDNASEHSAAIVGHHDSIKWFEAIPGEQLCIRVHGTQVNGRYAIMENIVAPGTATPMHFHAEDEIFRPDFEAGAQNLADIRCLELHCLVLREVARN